MSKIKEALDYIGCHYYAWNIDNLRIAYKYQATASASPNNTFLPGNIVLICASQHEGVYCFLAEAEYVYPDRVASDIWKGFHRPNHKVTKLKVLSPIKLIPSDIHGDMTRAGIMKTHRKATVQYLKGSLPITPVVCKKPPTIIEQKRKPVVITHSVDTKPAVVFTNSKDAKPTITFGFVYILKHATHGYKIGVTTNIKRRFKELEVGIKATLVGIWSSGDYKSIEKHLHNLFFEEHCPQSEWFDISSKQLYTAINLLNKYAECITCTVPDEPTKVSKVSSKIQDNSLFIPGILIACFLFGGLAVANDPNPQIRPYSQYEQVN